MFHLDTDMGVDDGLALLLADKLLAGGFALSTVFGNVPLPVATRNALLFRELLGRNTTLTVVAGADRASDGFSRDARDIHGEDGLGNATSLVDATTLRKISSEPVARLRDATPPANAEVVLVGIGPATNIPRLIDWYGRSAVRRIVLMSGVFFDEGNITPTAEFNAHNDPAALNETLARGIPTTLVPLDVCRKVQITRAAMRSLEKVDHSPVARLVVASHMLYMDHYRAWEGIDGCYPHDALALLVALAPDRFYRLRGTVAVDGSDARRGTMTFTPSASSHVEIVTGGDLKWAREMLADLLDGADARKLHARLAPTADMKVT